jgi:FMN phosphatase YigB (HAD superfamily)
MNPQIPHALLIDIDGTITGYQPGALAPEKLFEGNFLFPILLDELVNAGYSRKNAEEMLKSECSRNVFWNYTSLIRTLAADEKITMSRFEKWHQENLFVHQDMVTVINSFAARGVRLCIISNNPVDGCKLKLRRAGIEPDIFYGIFGTDILLGCKGAPGVWQRALEMVDLPPELCASIGDDPLEDIRLPQECGIGQSFLLNRSQAGIFRKNGRTVEVGRATGILEFFGIPAVI